MTTYVEGQLLLAGGCLVVFVLLFVVPAWLVVRAQRARPAAALRATVTATVVRPIQSLAPPPGRPAAAVWPLRIHGQIER